MNPRSEEKAQGVAKFIIAKAKEFDFYTKLVHVKKAAEILKREDSNNSKSLGLIVSTYDAIKDLKRLLGSLIADPNPDDMYSQRFDEIKQSIVDLIEELKKETNFFRGKVIFADEILKDLEKATTKFKEIAD